ncbi:6565_t:CDS:2, partial [Dentiscutata erythropus]
MGRTGINKNKIQPTNSINNVSAYPISSRFRTNLTGKYHHIFKPERHFLKKDNMNFNKDQESNDDQARIHNKNNDIMVSLAAILKKRENQTSKSVDREFEISSSTIISTLSSYIGKDDDIS